MLDKTGAFQSRQTFFFSAPPQKVFFFLIVSVQRLIKITLLTLVQATTCNTADDVVVVPRGVADLCILNEDTHPVVRAIGVSHTACEDEFR